MRQYLDLMQHVYKDGATKEDRTGTGTRSVFGYQSRYDLTEGFPIVTTKKLHLRSIIHELLWFLKGDTNIEYLQKNNVKIWDDWADASGNLGPVYGSQWRSWPTANGEHIDQISQVVEQIRNTPDSRRLIVSAWNVGEIKNMALPPCHAFFQFYVADGRLSCQHLFRRTIQYCFLRFTNNDDCAINRFSCRRIHPHSGRCTPVFEPPRANKGTTFSQAFSAPYNENQPGQNINF